MCLPERGGESLAKIIVVFPKIEDAKKIRNLLVRNGFDVAGVCNSGAQVLNLLEGLTDGIVLCGYKLADMMYGELKSYLPPGFEMLLAVSKQHWSECSGNDIVCLAFPLRVHELVSTVEMMAQQADRRRRRRKSMPKERSAKDRETIERAKALLMERNNMEEEEAHRYLQKCSMESGNSLVETALMVFSLMKL